MIELRCGGCGLANAVLDAAMLAKTRCAECEHPLDEERRVRYHVAEHGSAVGPLTYSDLKTRVVMGSLTSDTLLSEEGGPWMRAGERVDLLPRRVPARGGIRPHPLPRPRSPARTKAPPIPGPVTTMAVLDFVLGGLLLLLAFIVFALLSSFGGMAEAVGPTLLFVVAGSGLIGLGRGLQQRSSIAHVIQLGLAALAGTGLLALAVAGSASLALVGGLFVAVPFLLLLPEDVRAWFRGEDGSD